MLVLVRHGESEANAEHRLVGRADSPLTERGRRQAAATGLAMAVAADEAGSTVAAIVSSPLARAAGTASIIAATCAERLGAAPAVRLDERAIELDYGALDGAEVSAVAPAAWAAWRSDPDWRPSGGESLREVAERFASLLDELAEAAAHDDVVVVSHVSPIKAGAAWALGAGAEISWRMSLGVSSVTRIVTAGRVPALRSFGETAHLSGT